MPPFNLSPPPRRQREQGIALMLVLWIIALLTVIAIGMTSIQRTESRLASNQIETARFRALADAGVRFAALNLMSPATVEAVGLEQDPDADLWVPDGRPQAWSFAGHRLEIRIRNEASLIDLNAAPRELLDGLLSAVGVEEEARSALLDAILDWRDADDLHLLNGAEDPDYDAAGRPHGAKDGPFHSVEELRQVLGIDQDLYRALAPALTVSSGQARVLYDLAPPLVRAALDGVTLDEMEERLQDESASQVLADVPPTLNRGGPLYRIEVRRETEQGARQSMEALVRIQQTRSPPVNVLWRRFGLVLEEASSDETEAAD